MIEVMPATIYPIIMPIIRNKLLILQTNRTGTKARSWHDNGKAKRSFINKFREKLKGEDNPDFYQDKDNNEIILRGRRNNRIEVETKIIIDLKK